MALKRGDIIEVYFDFPRVRSSKPHPAIIISNEDVYDVENGYICVIMTSSKNFIDKFTFEITENMLERPNNKEFSQARCHLVTFVFEQHLGNKNNAKNTLKPNSVERLISFINETSFSEDY
jgi:mRNA interferase MazF